MPSPKERTPRIDPENEHQAAMAEHAYFSVEPSQMPGTIPVRQLQEWRTNVQLGQRTPQRVFSLAWLAAEAGHTVGHKNRRASKNLTSVPEATAWFEAARKDFVSVVQDKQTPSLLRLQARLGIASVERFGIEYGSDNQLASVQSHDQYQNKLLMISTDAIDYATRAKTTHDRTFMQTLTALNLLNDDPRLLVFPIPPRISNSLVDAESHAQLEAIDREHGYSYQLAISSEPTNGISFTPSLFAHETYPATHPYGTLQVFLEISRFTELGQLLDSGIEGKKRMAVLKEYNNLKPGIVARAQHVRAVTKKIKSSLDDQIEKKARVVVEKAVFRSGDDVLRYYLQIEPNSSLAAESENIQRAVAFLESRPRSELSTEELMVLGVMQLDLGIQDARERKFSASGHFNKSVLLFSGLAENAKLRGDTADYYTKRMLQLTVPVYAALAGNDSQIEDRVDDYRRQLSELAAQLYEKRNELSESHPKVASELAVLEPQVAIVLLLSGEGRRTRDTIAVPSLFRQTGVKNGWDITAWSRTQEGYDFDFFGRVKFVNNTTNTAEKNPYALAVKEFGGDSLYNILNVMWGDAETVENFGEQEAWVNYLRDQVKSHFAPQLD